METQRILADMLGAEGARSPERLRGQIRNATGAISVEGNAYIIDVDEAHERVHVYHESIDHLDAEMSLDEFFRWCDEILAS